MNNTTIIYGIHSIDGFLSKSPDRICEIYIDANINTRIQNLVSKIVSQNIIYKLVSQHQLDEMSNTSKHQGVVAIVKNLLPITLAQLLLSTQNKSTLLVLDGITDPHNLGAIIRSAECFGVSGVILPKHNSASINNAHAIKAASGAMNLVPIAIVNNINQALDTLKENGFWIAGTTLSANAVDIKDFKPPEKIAWIIGSEGKGMRQLTSKCCDYLVTIKMSGVTQSLNVSVATGLLLGYQYLRS